MTSKFVSGLPIATFLLIGSFASADAADVKVPPPLIVAKSGQHCKDDPNCFNRIHYAIKPAARVAPGQTLSLKHAMASIPTSI